MYINHRLLQVQMSPTAAVMAEARRLQRAGETVLDLGAGQPDFDTPVSIRQAAVQAIEAGHTRYTQPEGIPELRAAVAARMTGRTGVPLDPGQVVITNGAKHALALMCLALLEPGDEAIILSPYWVSFPEMVRLTGGRPVIVPCSADRGFHPDVAQIMEQWTPKTRLLILNFPNNPSGAALVQDELDAIVEAVAERGGVVLSDETYEDLVFDGRPPATAVPWLVRAPEHVAVVGSSSKSYAMTGWRLGWVVGDRALMNPVARFMSHTTSNACSISQYAALAALTGSQDVVAMMRDEYQVRRDLVVGALNEIPGVACSKPEGAFYAFPRILSSTDSTSFARELLGAKKVAVVPGAAFGVEGAVRISFACSRDTLMEAVTRIGEFIAETS
ncbi:MAG: pyridoxal phosphate-dependent aminotransferase [Acidobacteria bacterium]|nr:pyridoxal phosphate-dependent aminotransferase [Acidobacteriota bacterium]